MEKVNEGMYTDKSFYPHHAVDGYKGTLLCHIFKDKVNNEIKRKKKEESNVHG